MNLSVCVGVGLGGNCECRCGILYAPMWRVGVVYAGLVSLTSPYSSELFVLGGGWSASGVLLRVRVRRLGAFGF